MEELELLYNINGHVKWYSFGTVWKYLQQLKVQLHQQIKSLNSNQPQDHTDFAISRQRL